MPDDDLKAITLLAQLRQNNDSLETTVMRLWGESQELEKLRQAIKTAPSPKRKGAVEVPIDDYYDD